MTLTPDQCDVICQTTPIMLLAGIIEFRPLYAMANDEEKIQIGISAFFLILASMSSFFAAFYGVAHGTSGINAGVAVIGMGIAGAIAVSWAGFSAVRKNELEQTKTDQSTHTSKNDESSKFDPLEDGIE